MSLNRRSFLNQVALAGAAAALPAIASKLFAGAPPEIRITGMGFLRMKFPGKLPRMRNSIIWSGGGQPSMTQLEIYTDAGITGRSLPNSSGLIPGLFDRVKGENPFFVERIWDRMYRHNRKPVAKGSYISAMGSVDMAIWDIIGKALGLPVYQVLGAHSRQLRVYAAGGYYRDDKTDTDLANEMEGYVAEGFRAVKMKVGGESMNADRERVRVVRDAVGPDIDILIDANNKWNAYDAIRFGRMVEQYNLYWFEEPVEPDDFEGCAEVKAALDTPVVAGENEYTRWGCRDLIEHRSADILNLDTVNSGGITEYRKIAALASAHHIPVAPHGSPHMAAHLLASTPNALIMETYPGVQSQYNPALPLYPVKDGFVEIPDSPGLGIDPAPEMIKKYKVD
jgi:L-alanine-DL-glutamate epimerase-like enolase superfamily enzyme